MGRLSTAPDPPPERWRRPRVAAWETAKKTASASALPTTGIITVCLRIAAHSPAANNSTPLPRAQHRGADQP